EVVVAKDPFSRRPVSVPHFTTLSELVQTLAARGDRTALYSFRGDELERMSYAQLADAIERGARALRSRGIDREHSVLIWAPTSPEWIVAYFSAVCAGATAIPIDNQSTAASVATVLEHARPRLLLTTTANLAALEAADRMPDVVLLDGEEGDPRAFRALAGAHDVG